MNRVTIDISYHGKPAKRYFNLPEQFVSNLRRYADENDHDTVITVISSFPEWMASHP